ncbi:hypothetical protein ACLOJK_019242 [Asimina triloba]
MDRERLNHILEVAILLEGREVWNDGSGEADATTKEEWPEQGACNALNESPGPDHIGGSFHNFLHELLTNELNISILPTSWFPGTLVDGSREVRNGVVLEMQSSHTLVGLAPRQLWGTVAVWGV